MESICLDQIIRFTLGKNPTRVKESEIKLYTPDDFEKDLHCINAEGKKSECVINLIKSKAAPVSSLTDEKCMTSNFIKCEFDEHILDQWYFCYQFNEGREIEQQISMYHQGTTLSVKRLNVKTIGDLKICLPPMEKQRLIGEMYKMSVIRNDLMVKQTKDINNLMMTMIRKLEED